MRKVAASMWRVQGRKARQIAARQLFVSVTDAIIVHVVELD
jgi:hypothetical protein